MIYHFSIWLCTSEGIEIASFQLPIHELKADTARSLVEDFKAKAAGSRICISRQATAGPMWPRRVLVFDMSVVTPGNVLTSTGAALRGSVFEPLLTGVQTEAVG